mgnify:CR=1 FL=1
MLIYGGKSKYCFKILINSHTYWFATAQLIKLRNSSIHQPLFKALIISLNSFLFLIVLKFHNVQGISLLFTQMLEKILL